MWFYKDDKWQIQNVEKWIFINDVIDRASSISLLCFISRKVCSHTKKVNWDNGYELFAFYGVNLLYKFKVLLSASKRTSLETVLTIVEIAEVEEKAKLVNVYLYM